MLHRIILLLIISAFLAGAVLIESVHAQDSTNRNNEDSDSGERAEATEDAYRKRMELQDARDKNTFTNSTYTAQVKQEKIDKLPKESRDNIRAQLTDIIIENGQWEPSDILNENPYTPTEAAEGDPALREQEEEAWSEQLEKYHQREAAAFGASRPPMPGSNSQQAAGGPEGSGQEQDGQSDSQDGSQGEGEQQGKEKDGQGETGQQDGQGENGSAGSAGSYDPYQSQQNDRTDEISTAGVSESALDFLKAQQGQGSGDPGQMSPGEEDAQQAAEEQSTQQQASLSQAQENPAEPPPDSQDSQQQSVTDPVIPGTIAIKDLNKLEGLEDLEDEDVEPDN